LESHEPEPSYYEVALTNRQVVTGFVILLACLFAAFLSGVWLGKGGAETPSAAATVAQATPDAAQTPVEQLSFFNNRDATKRVGREPARPDAATPPEARPKEPAPADTEAEKLRQTLEAEMAAHRDAGKPAPEPEASTAAPGTRIRRDAAADAAAPTAKPEVPAPAPRQAEASTSTGGATTSSDSPAAAPIWIQVYSSTNGSNAENLAAKLRRSSFKALVLEAEGSGEKIYRVRVGPYARREDADRAAARLRREFRLDTWITDQP